MNHALPLECVDRLMSQNVEMEGYHPSVHPSIMQMVRNCLCTMYCTRYKSCPQEAHCTLRETDLLPNFSTF